MVCMCHVHERQQTRNTMLRYGTCEIAMTSRCCLLPFKHRQPTEDAKHAKNIFRNHVWPRLPGFVGEVRRGWPLFLIASNMIDHFLPTYRGRPHSSDSVIIIITIRATQGQALSPLSPSPRPSSKPSRPLIISLAAAVPPRPCCRAAVSVSIRGCGRGKPPNMVPPHCPSLLPPSQIPIHRRKPLTNQPRSQIWHQRSCSFIRDTALAHGGCNSCRRTGRWIASRSRCRRAFTSK